MDINYLIQQRTGGANPFHIFNALKGFNPDTIYFAVRRISYGAFLKSAYWFAVSTVAKSEAGMRCQVCNSPNCLQVHHRDYSIHGREHLNMRDLVVLCGNCHGLFHGHKEFVPPRLKMFDPLKSTRVKIPKNFTMPHDPDEIVVPDCDPVILSRELLDACKANGTFTNATLRALGVKKADMWRGWASRLIGTNISRENYRLACEGRYIYKSGKLA